MNTLTAFRHADYRLLFGGLVASGLGQWMQQFAIGWLIALIAVREGSPERAGFYIGVMSLLGALPSLATGLLAGVYADRVDRRDLLTAARIASAIIAVVLAVLAITGDPDIVVLIVLAAAGTAAFSADPPGRNSILPNVVPESDLLSAVGLTRATMQIAHTGGPLIAGVLVTPLGVPGVLTAKAALDGASIVALRLMKPQPVEASAQAAGVLDSLREGLGHVRRDRVVRSCMGLQLVFAVFAMSYTQLLPAVAVDTLRVGAVELSWLIGAGGTGSLLGAILLASSGRIERRGLLMLSSMLAVGAFLLLLGLQREVLSAIVILGFLGVAQQMFLGTQSVILQIVAPDRLRGRVMGIQSVIFYAASPLGVFALGTLGALIGISNALLLGGAVVLLVALVALLRLDVIRAVRTPWRPLAVVATEVTPAD